MQDLIPATLPGLWVRADFRDADECVVNDIGRHDGYRLRELPSGAKRIVDVGAHIGVATVKMLERWPDAHVVCIEPVIENVKVLEHNVDGRNATVIQGACTYEPGAKLRSSVFPGSHNTGASYVQPPHIAPLRKNGDERYIDAFTDVPIVTLEHVMDLMEWTSIDVLKMDCEGAEISIMHKGPMDRVAMMVGEWHDRATFTNLLAHRFGKWTFKALKQQPPMGNFHLLATDWERRLRG